MLDARLVSFTALGCSLLYLRLDAGTRTGFMVDVERVKKSHRATPLEGLLKLGPWQATNRTWYAA